MLRRTLTLALAPLLALLPCGPAHGDTAPLSSVVDVCGAPSPGHATCFARKYVGIHAMTGGPAGYDPADLQSAYALPSTSGGIGQTVYIVDAYDNPNAESELATYRAQYGLPACTTANGCFAKLNQVGAASPLPVANSGWASEIALDLDMVSAVCPNCRIRLLEASDTGGGLYTAIQTAITMGAHYVSLSWGGPEWSGETQQDAVFNAPGVLFAVSTGDSGYAGGVSYPAASASVLAVGGTSLRPSTNARGWDESAWAGAGSGCSAYEPKPTWQGFIPSSVCARRALADVSAVADAATGVAVYHGGWGMYGGTSASAPIVAAAYALAGSSSTTNPTSFPYSNTNHLTDVTSGTSGSCGSILCAGAAGWDGPTGLGTPIGIAALNGAGSSTPVTAVLSGTVAPVSGVAGLPAAVSATAYPPSGATLASVAWRSARTDCLFANPASLSTTVDCNATATGSTTISAVLTDSTGGTKTITAPLTFTPVTTKRATSVRLAVDGQAGTASVCAGVGAAAVATVLDTATGQPVKGASVTFATVSSAGAATTIGIEVTRTDGTASRSVALSAATTLGARAVATGAFDVSALVPESVAVRQCTPTLTASADTASLWYGAAAHVSGRVVRPALGGGGTLPMSGVRVKLSLITPSVTVGGPAVVTQLGTPLTAADGSYTSALTPTRSGEFRAEIAGSTGIVATSIDVGPIAVRTASTALTATASTSAVMYGAPITISGGLQRITDAPAGLGAATIAFSIVPDGSTTAQSLGSARTASNGTYAGTVVPRLSGHLRATYAAVPGTTGSTVDLGEVTVTSWTPSLTLASSAPSVVLGGHLTLTGSVTRAGGGTSGPAGQVAVRLVLLPSSGAAPMALGTAITTSTGAFTVIATIRVAGTIVARVDGMPGYTNASSSGVPVAVI